MFRTLFALVLLTGAAPLAHAQFSASLYSGTGFQTLVVERADETIDFNWGAGAPASGVPTNNFTARWIGTVVPAHSDTYTFFATVDDGVRLRVNGALVIDQWAAHSSTQFSAAVPLTAGVPATLQLEFLELTGNAECRFEWSSPSEPRRLVRTGAAGGLYTLAPLGPFLAGALPAGTPNTASGNWVLADAFPNLRFRDPLTFTPEPGTNRIFVGSRQGVIESFVNSPGSSEKQTFLDLSDRCAVVWDGGFLGHAFHPEWGVPGSPNRNYFYVYYCYAAPGTPIPPDFGSSQSGYFFNCYLRLARFTKPEGQSAADPNSETVLFNVRLYNGSHRGGGMFFRNDGFLYLSIGDQFRYTTAQDISNNFEGGVIRIDVDQQGGAVSHPPLRRMGVHAGFAGETSGVGYYIPNDNPFLDPAGGKFEEFWTVGHRNPHRMTLDVPTQRIWSGEIGQNTREEINVIEGGRNYQWPFKEGFANFSYAPPANPLGVQQPPAIDFIRAEANAIIGGFVYRGIQHPSLYGRYLCGDYGQQRIWALDYNSATGTATKQYLLNFTPGSLCTFGQDHQGEVYLCGLGNNVPIRRLAREVGYPEAPQLLSQTGVFSDLVNLVPRPGLVPYEVNAPLWTDGAQKRRWLAVPTDGNPSSAAEKITYTEQDEWGFPLGSVLVKHFETPEGRRLETRLLVNGADGWYGITYKWDAAGNDATLLGSSLLESVVIGGVPVEYYYPSRSDCLTCHNMQAGSVLGIKTRQLNSDVTYPTTGATANQVRTLNSLGLLAPALGDDDLDHTLTSVGLDDDDAPLELRLRSYLDANCSQCHQPGQGHSAIDARLTRMLPFQGLIDGGVTENFGLPGARVIAPGDLDNSILHLRVSNQGGCCNMPPLGTGLVNAEFVSALEQWILALEPATTVGTVAQSSTAFNGPATNAVDTEIEGTHNNGNGPGAVTHTASEAQPWWDTDLGTLYELSRVRLWNRTDCCGERLTNFRVLVSPTPFTGTTLANDLAQPGVVSAYYPGTVGREDTIDIAAIGRYVRVRRVDTGILSIAEFQFEGHTLNGGVGPLVDAGPDTTATVGTPITLAGTVSGASGTPTQAWSVITGHGAVNFGAITSLVTPATFYIQGTYTIRLTVNAGGLVAFDDLTVVVTPALVAPNVDAGPDRETVPHQTITLQGVIAHPQPWLVSVLWERISGPGGANFSQNQNPVTGVTLYTPGTFVLRLTATAGAFSASDTVTVIVGSGDPPIASAGPDFSIGLAQAYPLQGAVTPGGAAVTSVLWSKVSGPGSVNFTQITRPDSGAIFYVPGTYVLRLTASDGVYTTYDEVTALITVINEAPIVSAGPDLGAVVTVPLPLEGSVMDDTPGVQVSWSRVSGPGSVNFLFITQPTSSAIFYVPGTYVLRLTANDGEFVVYDEKTVTVTL